MADASHAASSRDDADAGQRQRGAEWERDVLIWLAGQSCAPPFPGDLEDADLDRAQEYFWAWMGEDAVRHASPGERARTIEAAETLAGRLRAAGALTRPVLCIDQGPAVVVPPVRGRVSRVLERARRAGAAPLVDLAVAAGPGRALWDEPSETWVVVPPAAGLPHRRYVALRVAGDSMNPLLHSGDVVLVDLEGDVLPGAVVVARQADERDDGGYVVKRIGQMSSTSLELTSLNPRYPPLTIPRDRRHVVGTVVLRWCEHPPAASSSSA